MTTALTPRLSIVKCVAEYETATDEIRLAFDILARAQKRLDETFTLGGQGYAFDLRCSSPGKPERLLTAIKDRTWGHLFERLELQRMMSCQRWEETQQQLTRGKMPELTLQATQDLFRSTADQLDQMLTEAVSEVYQNLRPWRNDYKTNDAFKVGERVILDGYIEQQQWHKSYGVRSYYEQHLTALDNVFHALDGRGSIARTYKGPLRDAIERSETGRGATEYFEFKCFKKGTIHLKFLRMDLVFKLNQIAGKSLLKESG